MDTNTSASIRTWEVIPPETKLPSVHIKQEIRAIDVKIAEYYRSRLMFSEVIKIYEEHRMEEEAKHVHGLLKEWESAPEEVRIALLDKSIKISDSIIQKSFIGSVSLKKISIYPYYGKELEFPEPPKFCPYYQKQILK